MPAVRDDTERLERLLVAWGQWIGSGGRGDGFPKKNVLHESWLPPARGSVPMMAVGVAGRQAELALHEAIDRLSVRLKNTLVVVYVLKLSAAEQALRLECAEATVRERVRDAKRRLLSDLV